MGSFLFVVEWPREGIIPVSSAEVAGTSVQYSTGGGGTKVGAEGQVGASVPPLRYEYGRRFEAGTVEVYEQPQE